MPKLDGTGPEGKGKGTGRGLGKCSDATDKEKLEKLVREWVRNATHAQRKVVVND